MMEEATVDEVGSFIYNNGLFDWKLAKVVKEFEPEHYIISVPTLKHDTLQSILFVAVNNSAYSFFHITKDQLQADTEVLLEQFGPGNLIISIFSFFQYSQVLGSKRAFDFLYAHLTHPKVAEQLLEIAPRGWCLIEIELYTENQSAEDDEICNCGYYNPITGTHIMNPPTDEHPSNFDDKWELYEWNPGLDEAWYYTNYDENGTVIHGSPGEHGTTVYQFWAWCEDEVGQDPWSYNWTTNLEPTGGGGGPIHTGPDWSYDNPRWDENTMDCMFAFNHPHTTAEINQLEEALLMASCGEAAEYSVKSIIDNIVIRLCNEYYDNQEAQGGEVPQFPMDTPHDLNETLEEITSAVEGSSYYQIGQEICEVCDNALSPGPCYEAVNNCGTEEYEGCVEEVLCGYSLQAFRAAYNLSLPYDDACTDHPEVVQFLLEHQGSVQLNEEEIQWLLENNQIVEDILAKVENSDVIEEIIDLLFKHNLHLPCNPGITSEAIIASVVNNDNFQNNPEVETFYQTLAEEDYIIEDASFMSCTYAQCIYDKILASDNPSNCKLVNPLFNDDDFGLVLHLSDKPYSYTTFDNESNMANMYISLNCNGTQENDLDIAASIIHELIHAEIMMTLFELGLNPNNLESFDDAWDNYQLDYMLNLKNTYDLNDIHHAVMVFVEGDDDVPGGGAVDRIAKILWELKGQQLTIEHYYHLAWGGLRYIDSQWAEDEYGTNSEYYNLHQELLTLNPNLSLGC